MKIVCPYKARHGSQVYPAGAVFEIDPGILSDFPGAEVVPGAGEPPEDPPENPLEVKDGRKGKAKG